MTVEEIELLGVAVAFLFGAGGLVIGIVNAVQNHRTRDRADEANKISEGARQEAARANELSAESNKIAKGAVEKAVESERRQVERHDVAWDYAWTEVGELRVFNDGRDVAHEVHMVVNVDDERVEGEADHLGHGEGVVLEFPQAAQIFRNEYSVFQRERAASAYASAIPQYDMHHLEIRVTWRTELGSPKQQEYKVSMFSLEP